MRQVRRGIENEHRAALAKAADRVARTLDQQDVPGAQLDRAEITGDILHRACAMNRQREQAKPVAELGRVQRAVMQRRPTRDDHLGELLAFRRQRHVLADRVLDVRHVIQSGPERLLEFLQPFGCVLDVQSIAGL